MDNLNINPALKNFFKFNAGEQLQQETGGSNLRDSLLETGQAPTITTAAEDGVREAQPNGCVAGMKTALRVFIIYLIVGLIAAILIKSMTVVLAVTVIVLFILIQVMTASGMVAINWSNIGNAVVRSVDRDGDGKFGWNDFKAWVVALVTFISSRGVPALSGLALGAFMGFKFS
mmetsp:Transcript_28823/g.81201  ORF Transcript_28823/g.81201 Transcript_28823/m.81201 type:complete len:174 (+) Transcript_28823:328-849(+)